jgi:hypothetical protein
MSEHAVMIGRVCPIHPGHEMVVGTMIETFGIENCLFGIGSSNHALSLRHFFSYGERRGFVQKIFPGLKVFGLPDYPSDEEWLTALDDILRISGVDPKTVTFFGGCQEDVRFFYEFGRTVQIMNRFDGTTPKVSATEVRDALISGRGLDNLLNPLIAEDVHTCFKAKWELFKKM